MSLLSPSTLEDHVAGGMVNAIINGNWDKLNEIFDPATVLANERYRLVAMALMKLDATALNALADGVPLTWDATNKKVVAAAATTGSFTVLSVTNRAILPTYTVAQLNAGTPVAAVGNERAIVYCSDGDAGAKCLAVSDGTNWLRIPFGAAVAV